MTSQRRCIAQGAGESDDAGIPDPSVLTGPSFEYQPVNPAG